MSSEDLVREAQDPSTSPGRLQELAQADRGTWVAIASHPAAYPTLLDWLTEHGDDSVREAVASRIVPPPPPPAPPAPPVVDETVVLESAPVDPVPTQVQAAMSAAPLAADELPASSHQDIPAEKPNNRGVVRGLIALAVVAVLVGGGWFAVSALTGDDEGEGIDLVQADSTKSADDADDDSSSGGVLGGGSDDGDSASPEFCATMEEIQGFGTDTLGGGTDDPLDSLEESEAQLEKMSDLYEKLEDSAPAELKAEATEMKEFMDGIQDAATDGEMPSTDMDSYLDAATKLSTYYFQSCS